MKGIRAYLWWSTQISNSLRWISWLDGPCDRCSRRRCIPAAEIRVLREFQLWSCFWGKHTPGKDVFCFCSRFFFVQLYDVFVRYGCYLFSLRAVTCPRLLDKDSLKSPCIFLFPLFFYASTDMWCKFIQWNWPSDMLSVIASFLILFYIYLFILMMVSKH